MKDFSFSKDIKTIRTILQLTQQSFADALGVSRVTLVRYENGVSIPEPKILEAIYDLAYRKGIRLAKAKAELLLDDHPNEIILFHGAKKEIDGPIDANHTDGPADFGNAFYLGENLEQAGSWVFNRKGSSVYCFRFTPDSDWKAISLPIGMRWMQAILYFRGRLDKYRIPASLQKDLDEIALCDYLIAPIADNQMYDVLETFGRGEITDEACLHALSANRLGKQYVMKSERACQRLVFADRFYLCQEERKALESQKANQFAERERKVRLSLIEYRRKGKYIDELFDIK